MSSTQPKREYLDAEVQLGWLINPQQQQVKSYRRGRDVEVLALPAELSGDIKSS